MPELASLPEKPKDQPAHTSTDMKANNNNRDKSGSGTIAEPSSMSSPVTTTIATQQDPPLDKTPKAGEEEAEEGEVMEDIEEGELEEDDTKGVPSQDQSLSQSQSQSQIQNNQQKEEGDQDMKEASPEPVVEDEEASSAMSTDKPEQSHIGEEINEDDLNGGLLDGALDDYDDLDQDTEDTEVGNGEHDFSDDDDDDDDDLLDQQLMSDKLDPDDVEMHTPNTLADVKSEERDTDAQGEDEEDEDEAAGSANEKDAPHSEDSDSDLPDPDPSDLEDGEVNEDAQEDEDEEDEEEDEEGNLDEEDEDEEEDEAQKKSPTPKKDVVFPQKPTLNRSQATEEELKDSGDELSDLSEFDDTDDSDEDEDDRVPGPKSGGNDLPASAPSGASSSAPSKSGGSGSSSATGKPGAGGRKKSVQENADDKQDASKGKSTAAPSTDQKVEHPVEVPNGRARLIEPAGRSRTETNHSDKDSGSDAAEENEEEEEEAPEETPVAAEQDEEEEGGDEEDDDLETKQIHKEALEALTSIEVEFACLRDKMYEERMMELDKEVEMINSGTHPELSSLMQEIAQKREQRLQVADAGKRYKSEIARSQFEVAEYLAHCTFQSARRNARGDMARDLGSKQRKMILELTSSADSQKRKVLAEKSTLIRARKQRRMEVAELKSISERRAFPASSKLTMVSSTELEDDFSAMGLARLLPQLAQPAQPAQHQYVPEQEMYGHRPMAPSAPGPIGYGPSMPHPSRAPPVHNSHNNRWPEPEYPPQHQNMAPPSGRYYDSRQEVEIYVDGSRCNIDGMWYKPQDSVVVLDAQIGKYKAKYLFLANDEIVLQRTDGSKTKLHLGLFRGRKLYMQPQ
ncbi:Transcriptional regulatory protein [Podila verticillata]|nr:Transcriptional regulatory protein [Podila verticillata]